MQKAVDILKYEPIIDKTLGKNGVKFAWPWFLDKNDVIVAIATACTTVETHWVCGEFNAKSCSSVETDAQGGIGG